MLTLYLTRTHKYTATGNGGTYANEASLEPDTYLQITTMYYRLEDYYRLLQRLLDIIGDS